MMRRATFISVSVHGLALAVLLNAALGESAAVPVPPPPGIAVTLAALPAPKPVPPMPKLEPPKPVPVPPQPTATPKSSPKPAPKPAPMALNPSPAPVAAPAVAAVADVDASEPAPAAAPAPAPTAPPAPSAAATPETIWLGQVRAKLEAVKRYPLAAARRRDQGVAIITFDIDPDGRVLTHGLSRSSGSSLLDREAEDLPERAAPLPPMPEGMPHRRISLTLPVSFALR